MAEPVLRLAVCTPHGIELEQAVRFLTVPTHTGRVGLRPRCEKCILALEPGLLVSGSPEQQLLLGIPGGLLVCDGESAKVLTPLVVRGADRSEILRETDRILGAADPEIEVRRAVSRLEQELPAYIRETQGVQSRRSPSR